MTIELHIAADGQEYGLGLTDPIDPPVGAPLSFPVMGLDQIRAALVARGNGDSGYHMHRTIFDLSWNSHQRNTNACNGHATARALTRSIFLKTRERVLLSGSDAYSRMNGGRDQGSSLAAGMRVVTDGIALESTVPWNLIYPRQIPAAAASERARFRGHEPIAVDSEEEFATGILMGFQGVVAVHVDRGGRYESVDGRGVSRGGNGSGNHAVGVDDLRLAPDGTIEYDQYGSWGGAGGVAPRVWLRWDQHLRETVRRHRFWLLSAALDDPQGENPPAVKE